MTVNEPKLISGPARRAHTGSTTPKRPRVNAVRNTSVPREQSIQEMNNHNIDVDDAHESSPAFRARVTEIARFKVFSRVRPFIAEELAEMEGQERRSVVEMTDNKTVILDPKDDWTPKAQFEFDGSLWSIPPEHRIVHTFRDTKRMTYATQKNTYDLIAKELVPHVFDGFNSCILSYGQTGSGKTYTMMGLYDPNASCGGDGEEGIIPRVSNDLFTILDGKREEEAKKDPTDRINIRVEVSFVEIYMERVRDLLDPALKHTKGNEKLHDARIRQDPYSGPFVEGVTKYQVENWAQCCLLLERGSRHRTTCATAVHNQSSRSHAIFQLTVIQEQTIPAKDRYSRPALRCQAGRVNLVDLAGSERGGFQEYVKESAAINTSLLALRRVIDNLTERQNMLMEQAKAEISGAFYQERPLPQVPFRDSVLTWLLSDSIGGNARTTMIATLSPLVKNYGDTLATLQWSSKARNLVTLVKVNDAQTTVTGGMSHTAGELHNAVRIQRQNIDSMREALHMKRERAERLERESEHMMRQEKKNRDLLQVHHRELRVVVIQRAFHRMLWMRKMRALENQHAKLSAQLKEKQRQASEAEQSKLTADSREQASRAELEKSRKREEHLRERIAAHAQNTDEFAERYEEAVAQLRETRRAIGADDIEREYGEKLAAMRSAAQKRADDEKKEAEGAESRAAEMEEKVREGKTNEWRAMCKRKAEDVENLRKTREELQKQLEDAKLRRDALQISQKHKKQK